MDIKRIRELLGADGGLLEHQCKTISSEQLSLPGPDYLDRVFVHTDRKGAVLGNLARTFNTGRLAGTGYLSILPVDQGIEHSGGASFAPNPPMFDPDHMVRLALEGGCNAVASTFGALGVVARKYAHRIPFIVKINHNEFFSYPNTYDQTLFGNGEDVLRDGRGRRRRDHLLGLGESRRQLKEIADAFAHAHELGLFTVLWCYVRNAAFKTEAGDHSLSADFTGQANHLGVTIQADIIKQKLPTDERRLQRSQAQGLRQDPQGGLREADQRQPDRSHALPGGQLLHGAASASSTRRRVKGESDLAEAVKTAVINKRAGGMGLISGRKAFQRPIKEGAALLQAIQDVYLSKDVTIA
jgi:class I fructose-bisphosphate aldolase